MNIYINGIKASKQDFETLSKKFDKAKQNKTQLIKKAFIKNNQIHYITID